MLFKKLWLITILVHSSLFSWWDMGHMTVAEIAYEELEPSVKEKADRYLRAAAHNFPNHADFITASLWSDDIGHDGIGAFSKWHISSYPYDPEGILSSSQNEKLAAAIEGNDLVWVIGECLKTLKNPEASLWSKGFMLRILIHMVGDIHQPLHCTSLYNSQFPKGDRGGNSFKIKHERYDSLHSLFDAAFGLGERQPERPVSDEDRRLVDQLATFLKGEYPREAFPQTGEKNIAHWRDESHEIAVRFAYTGITPNERPPESYMQEGQEITGRQIALAGYRLADLLNQHLGDLSFEDVASTREVLGHYSSENPKVLEMYDQASALWTKYSSLNPGEWKLEKLLAAVEYAAKKHEGQTRKDAEKTPYIIHPIGVSKILWEIGGIRDIDILSAALLHDTLEDTDATEEDITALFSGRVLSIIKELSNDPNLSTEENKQRQIDHAPHLSYEAKLVKLADRLYNVRDLVPPPPDWSPEKVEGYYSWGEKLLDALRGTHKDLEEALENQLEARKKD